MNIQNFDPSLPESEGVDKLLIILRAAVAGVPFVGGSLTEAWSGFFSSPLTKRREQWLHELALAVVELQRDIPKWTVEELQKNEQFVTAVLTATSIAIRTHRKEKLEALRNAAISSARFPEIDEDLQAMFMRYVDEFTPWHLRILRAFHDPNLHFREIGSNIVWLVERDGTWWTTCKVVHTFMYQGFPSLSNDVQFMHTILHDLGIRQLIPVQQFFNQPLPDIGPFTTLTGQKFMKFIGTKTSVA